MSPRTSRPERWARAVARVRVELDSVLKGLSELDESLELVRELRDEYAEWGDALPDNLRSSPIADKLDAIAELDLDDEIESRTAAELIDLVEELETVSLPRGFGRD